ncbi:hypothetical protein ITJ66_10685 [Plantibacter sp. VKM Ac-2885]|uniref:Uncharacterized protein n=1 Tax=Plantibacter elymi (nom. nud.) TaxID=199708 RepID=A0ABY1RCB1_9MICO|nr:MULTISPECIES: hypothetical protein [Plantibacter]MBF4512950.1 hypothetical protein [Plantibacter sp. VKM Ac-2885]CAH0142752.1 hypothetical protein SRABI02_00570 [Plantibacter cousiniae]SMQ66876.1 hypothetical protein SAMN06295909_1292 [Plantibacter sp. VKM Ac-1784]
MTTHLDTSPNLFTLSTPRVAQTERLQVARPTARPRGRFGAFVGVLLGNIVLWSTLFITIGIVLALQLGIVGVIAASMLR